MSGVPFVSVVVVTYQREQVLVDTLGHLLRQNYPAWELLVVDQTPSHAVETEGFLTTQACRLRWIRLARPSMTHARNVGLQAARGDIVLYCDDDVIPQPGLLAAHARHYADPTVGGVTGRTTASLGAPQESAGKVQPNGWVIAHPDAATPSETDTLFGCNMSWRRGLLLRIGGFDEGYIMRAHREETDVSLRVRRLGYRLIYDPEAAVEHLVAPGGSRMAEHQHVYGWYHNNAYFYSKHFAPRALLGFLRIQLGHLIVRLVLGGRHFDAVVPSLRGLVDGYRAGAFKRMESRHVDAPGLGRRSDL
ncbi:MAG TPA: glycosyltransferase [Alphaproteobacteria bacterium]|nr:glycosyltransferase [Alphaproteobacteria bacterium]